MSYGHPNLRPNRFIRPAALAGDTAKFKHGAIAELCMEQAQARSQSQSRSNFTAHTAAQFLRLPDIATASPEDVARAVRNLLVEIEKNPTPRECQAFIVAYESVATDRNMPALMPVLLDWLTRPHTNNEALDQMISELEAECWMNLLQVASDAGSDETRESVSQTIREVMEQSPSTRILSMLEIALSCVSDEPPSTQELLFNTLKDVLPNLHGSTLKTLQLNVDDLWMKIKNQDPDFNARLKALCKGITAASQAKEQPLLDAHAAMVNFVPVADRKEVLRSKSDVPRTPTECAIHCISSIRLRCRVPGTTPEQKTVLATLEEQFLEAWLRHDLTVSHASHLFRQMEVVCRQSGLTDLGDLAASLQTQCESADFKSMPARLNDNVYSRVFETMLVDRLLTASISKEEADSAREFSRAWKDTLADMSTTHGEELVLRGIAKGIADVKAEPRSWLWRVPTFVRMASAKTPAQQKQALLNFLNSEKKTGFDLAALSICSYLANAASLKPHLPWKKAGDEIYRTIVRPNVSRIRDVRPGHTNVRGLTLHYQAAAIKEKGVGERSITNTRNDIENPSPVLSATLAHGIPSGGVSGSTNLKLFMVKDMREKGYSVEFKYALLDSIRQFNSGHSIHDALWTAQRLVDEGHIDWELDLHRYSDEEIAIDPDKAHVMDYRKFFQVFKGTETGDLLEDAVRYAMNQTVEYFRQHSDFHHS